MQDAQPNLFTRDDTLLGICQGLADDFGFNPLWLRLAFTPALFFEPVWALIGYAAAGLAVLGSRLLFPAPRAAGPVAAAPGQAPLEAANEAGAERLPIAA
ncbi:MAG TPA: PspC domain-containing protein [Allosphingosinicella sp.]|nr:PspC domain-containing protein [Allosphingosinicella sp.]